MVLVECVPNISEGRDPEKIKKVTDAIEGVSGITLLDVDIGADTNRTVITFVGEPQSVVEAAVLCVKTAAQVIDMSTHTGAHPRMGATDVVPFVPVSGITMEACADLARDAGEQIGALGIPVYLYEEAASTPERANLASVRHGEYEALPQKLEDPQWAPDFGPTTFNATAGATAVGAREFLIAYNINLNTTDRRYANEIAYELRERGRWKRTGNIEPFYYKGDIVRFPKDGTHPCGNCNFVGKDFAEASVHYAEEHGGDLAERYKSLGIDTENPEGPVFKDGKFSHMKAMGWVIEEYHRAQITMNLTNFHITPPHLVLDAAREEAAKRGLEITGSEIVGLIPYEAVRQAAIHYLLKMGKSPGLPVPDLVECAIQSMGLRDVSSFDPAKKILGLPTMDGELVNRKTFDFIDEVSRDTPAPGGGSVAALAGALGAALATMVANLCTPKAGFADHQERLSDIATRGQVIKDALTQGVDKDTRAFDLVIAGMRMPQDSAEERAERDAAMEKGYIQATEVPLSTVEQCRDALVVCRDMATLMDSAMASDVGSGALLALAGARAAAYNVRINLPSITDEAFAKKATVRLNDLLAQAAKLASEVESAVNEVLDG